MELTRTAVNRALLALACRRGVEKSFCPSEVARALAPGDWRELMPAVRAAAAALEKSGRLVWLQRGRRIEPSDARGAIRLRLAK